MNFTDKFGLAFLGGWGYCDKYRTVKRVAHNTSDGNVPT